VTSWLVVVEDDDQNLGDDAKKVERSLNHTVSWENAEPLYTFTVVGSDPDAQPRRRPSVSDIDTIRERHVMYSADPTIMRTDDDPQWCADCDVPWPCDTRVVLDALDETTRFTLDSLAAALHILGLPAGDTYEEDAAAIFAAALKEGASDDEDESYHEPTGYSHE